MSATLSSERHSAALRLNEKQFEETGYNLRQAPAGCHKKEGLPLRLFPHAFSFDSGQMKDQWGSRCCCCLPLHQEASQLQNFREEKEKWQKTSIFMNAKCDLWVSWMCISSYRPALNTFKSGMFLACGLYYNLILTPHIRCSLYFALLTLLQTAPQSQGAEELKQERQEDWCKHIAADRQNHIRSLLPLLAACLKEICTLPGRRVLPFSQGGGAVNNMRERTVEEKKCGL